MKARICRTVLLTSFLLGSVPGWCGEITFDLVGGDQTLVVEPDEQMKVILDHYLPRAEYSIEVRVEGRLLDAFGLSVFERGGRESRRLDGGCDVIVDRLWAIDQESGLGPGISRARIESSRLPEDERNACNERIDNFEEQTSRIILDPVAVGAGEAVVVEVCRPDGAGGKKCWVFTLTTGQTRRWLTHYGFAFLPDQDESFFAQENEAGDGFIVTAEDEADDDELEYEPTVTFTYIPNTITRRSPWLPYFTAGLGIDVVDDPVVFAGLSWVVGDNVNLFLGGAFHEQTRLRGMYDQGQTLAMTLTEEQLHETRFTTNVIAGIGFRFDGNPFKAGEEGSQSTAKKADPADPNDDDDGDGGSTTVSSDQSSPEEEETEEQGSVGAMDEEGEDDEDDGPDEAVPAPPPGGEA